MYFLPPYEIITKVYNTTYGWATISRLPKNTGLFCKRALQKRRYSAKETYILKRSLPIIATPQHIACTIYIYTYTNDRSLLQNIVSFIGLFCKRDLSF